MLDLGGGFGALLRKELLRFWRVAFQTVAAPVLTALLYLLIFSHVLGEERLVHGLAYTAFLVPGLVMMSVLQNAFANSSSSLIQSKVTGSLVFVLLPPISYGAFYGAFVLAASRGCWSWPTVAPCFSMKWGRCHRTCRPSCCGF